MDNKITKQRIGALIMLLVGQPFRYTKKELAQRFAVSLLTIDRDFKALEVIGLKAIYNKPHYRYGFEQDKAYDQLKNLLHFTEAEQEFLLEAIQMHADKNGKTSKRVERKLNSLYDFRKLGLDILRQPHLQKVNLLEKAKNERLQIILKNYHSSNSNKIKDRLVEPLQVSMMDDMVYAYDVEENKISHFRMTRIGGIKELNQPATFKKSFQLGDADPFYIVSDEKVAVRLEFGVAAYNELIFRFPLTKNYIHSFPKGDRFELQCDVNIKFYGISNFILNAHHDPVIVHDPPELLDLLQQKLIELQNFFRVYQ